MANEGKYLKGVGRVADIVLCVQGLVCLIALFHFIYYYSWTHERQFSSPVGAILYYLLLIVVLILSFGALRLKPAHKVNVLLLIVSMNILIDSADIWLAISNEKRLGEVTRMRTKAAKSLGVSFDARSKLQVITDLQIYGISASPIIWPHIFLKQQLNGTLKSVITINGIEVLPLGGIANKVTVLDNESGEYSTYESDEHGFNNPKGMWNAGRIDIVALGDSFTLGSNIPPDKNFVALIRSFWPETLNLGSYGVGPLIELAILQEYGSFIKPKVLLWFYYKGNDLQDLGIEKDSPLLMRYVESDFTQGLLARQAEIDQAPTTYVDGVRNARRSSRTLRFLITAGDVIKLAHLRRRLQLTYAAMRADPSGGSDATMDLFRKVLVAAQASISTWGAKLFFVYLPQGERYAGLAITPGDRERVLSLVRGIGLPVIDIHLAFQAQNDPLALFPLRLARGHYNETGNQLVAEEVRRSISLATDPVRPVDAISHNNKAHTRPLTSKAGLSNSSGAVK